MYLTAHPATTSSGQVFVMAPLFKLCLPALLLSVSIAAQAEDKTLNLYSWADYVAPDTLQRAWALGIHPRDSLDNNDGHGFFQALGDSVVTGPTLTNVNDFRAILIS